MEKEKLKELIVEHKERFLSKKDLMKREAQKEIERFIPQKEIVIITGVRRSGKSSLMRLVCDDLLKKSALPESNILYLNFEDERFVTFTVKDFESLYEAFIELENPSGRKYLFFDEIQNVKGWEKWLNRLYEFEDVKIFVSGSNASMLSSEISTALTGRNRQVVNWPFSFREFLAMKGQHIDAKGLYQREKRAGIKRLFKEYLELGGFPEVLKTNDPTLMEEYYRDILYRDVIARHSIKNIKEIKELSLFLAANTGAIQSYKNMQDLISVRSVNTVKNYLEALKDVYLFFPVDMFSYSLKRQIYNPSKYYCIDIAMSNAVSFKFSQNLGRLYENLVYLELKRRDKDVYYWKSGKGREVDFVVKEGLKIREAIQVCLFLSDKKTKAREMQALADAREEIKPYMLTIITEDEEGSASVNNTDVRVIPLWKWLISL